jgi:sulfur carrier protein ThiS
LKVKLDLSGELDDQLPDSAVQAWATPDGGSLAQLVSSLPFADRVALTSVNGVMVPPDKRNAYILNDGDEVMMLPPIKGG